MHDQFVEPSKKNADLIISGEADFDEIRIDIEQRINAER
jgi:uridine kinase